MATSQGSRRATRGVRVKGSLMIDPSVRDGSSLGNPGAVGKFARRDLAGCFGAGTGCHRRFRFRSSEHLC
ncbi:hypothetical protein D0N87_35290 [Pseudomonas sp. ATCC 13867]|nr:hypothetical protein D0N87_35290 [Pseudomonas sp. ATCC 13867]